MKLVVGLGNPGRQYQKTRHNVGFDVLAELARRFAPGETPSTRQNAELLDIRIDNEKVLLVAPQTFMNLSGQAVQPLVAFYDLLRVDVLVVCDDLNLELGQLRFRASGSAGGQKGLAHICQQLGSQVVPRLRIGIGRPPQFMNAADYVLGKFSGDERAEMDFAIPSAADAVETWVQSGIQEAMNKFNVTGKK